MDDLNEIFERATDADLDTELAAAGELLQKIAQQEGVDLSELSDEDVAELMVDLLPKTAADEGEHKSAREEYEYRKRETKMASEITFADVAVELSKVAANEGIDLDGLSRGQYHELFDIVAESMQDPDYMENKLAQDEANAKLAEADALGRYMARAFMDEQEKIALTEEEKAYHKMRMKMQMEGKDKDIAAMDPSRHTARDARRAQAAERLERVKQHANPINRARGAFSAAGEELKYQRNLAGKGVGGAAKALVETAKKHKGVAATLGAGGLLAAGGAAYGAKKLMDKQSFDEQALELARDYLLENGIDPDTGNKLASDYVAERAAEILAEAGWL
jgi:hypothetical protein